MTRPSAPCLTADYYTYSTYSPREDYYGGFEPDNRIKGCSKLQGPMRQEPENLPSTVRRGKKEKTFLSAYCIAIIYCVLAIIITAINGFMYYNGVKPNFMIYLTAVMLGIIITSLLMYIGILRQQPFFCIPFVVMRTMETFVSAVLLGVLTYALVQPKSDFFMFFVQCSKILIQLVSPHVKYNLIDATFQLCIIGWCFALTILSISIYVCRVAFHCTMSIADQVRYNRYQQPTATSQTWFAGDEFYRS